MRRIATGAAVVLAGYIIEAIANHYGGQVGHGHAKGGKVLFPGPTLCIGSST
jgi:hypothetical protein